MRDTCHKGLNRQPSTATATATTSTSKRCNVGINIRPSFSHQNGNYKNHTLFKASQLATSSKVRVMLFLFTFETPTHAKMKNISAYRSSPWLNQPPNPSPTSLQTGSEEALSCILISNQGHLRVPRGISTTCQGTSGNCPAFIEQR